MKSGISRKPKRICQMNLYMTFIFYSDVFFFLSGKPKRYPGLDQWISARSEIVTLICLHFHERPPNTSADNTTHGYTFTVTIYTLFGDDFRIKPSIQPKGFPVSQKKLRLWRFRVVLPGTESCEEGMEKSLMTHSLDFMSIQLVSTKDCGLLGYAFLFF